MRVLAMMAARGRKGEEEVRWEVAERMACAGFGQKVRVMMVLGEERKERKEREWGDDGRKGKEREEVKEEMEEEIEEEMEEERKEDEEVEKVRVQNMVLLNTNKELFEELNVYKSARG
mmetsp:Transcript_16429/g.18991  ORF Transcript_16429/g.18991 Transcript_16429/m.18991 type:complete len:118 (-) Transcript_16429:103-456(-)